MQIIAVKINNRFVFIIGMFEWFIDIASERTVIEISVEVRPFGKEYGAFYTQDGFPVEHIRDFGVSRFKAGNVRTLGLCCRAQDKTEKQEEQCFVHVAEWVILVIKDNT